jgi:hypothetical protein
MTILIIRMEVYCVFDGDDRGIDDDDDDFDY